jgi:hypothetical protein
LGNEKQTFEVSETSKVSSRRQPSCASRFANFVTLRAFVIQIPRVLPELDESNNVAVAR